MPAFRQVGEKQLPNPVLCMAWSPKRDLIALANTTGEVSLSSCFSYGPETCLCIFYGCIIALLVFFCSCCYTAWLVSSVSGAYRPVNILERRLLHLPGGLMAKVRTDSCLLIVMCLFVGKWATVLFLLPSIGLQPWRHQAGCPLWCWESRDPPCVSYAELCDVHALDGGDGGQQVSVVLRDQWHKGHLSLCKRVNIWSSRVF